MLAERFRGIMPGLPLIPLRNLVFLVFVLTHGFRRLLPLYQ